MAVADAVKPELNVNVETLAKNLMEKWKLDDKSTEALWAILSYVLRWTHDKTPHASKKDVLAQLKKHAGKYKS
ncbi:unnamed protein product [Amoebophrya sp. A25]|nr:unnamed protein product [Amoebophrya sp. A25]|eukprot:GSA25T00007756001.1